MSMEFALMVIQAFLKRGPTKRDISSGMKWKKGVSTIPRSQLKTPKVGREWEPRKPVINPRNMPKIKL